MIKWSPLGTKHSNHLNAEHLESKCLTFWTIFCQVFKQSDHVIRQTIKKQDIFDQKTDLLSSFQTIIKKPDNLTTGHFWTIPMTDLSGIQMVTVWGLWPMKFRTERPRVNLIIITFLQKKKFVHKNLVAKTQKDIMKLEWSLNKCLLRKETRKSNLRQKWRMQKAPSLIPQTYIFSVL